MTLRPEAPANLQQEIEIYPVGLLKDLAHFVHSPNRVDARRKLRYALRYPIRQARQRDWYAVRSYFSGYVAEAHNMRGISRCGTGWTRGRAYRHLVHIARAAEERR